MKTKISEIIVWIQFHFLLYVYVVNAKVHGVEISGFLNLENNIVFVGTDNSFSATGISGENTDCKTVSTFIRALCQFLLS